jgi:hypothetical protein
MDGEGMETDAEMKDGGCRKKGTAEAPEILHCL